MSRKEAIIRETKRKTLSLFHNVSYKAESAKIKGLLENYDPSPVNNVKPEKVRTVTFIITRMVRFHGGQTSVLHLGTELEKLGIKVSYLSYKPQSVEEMEICASANLPKYQGHLYHFNRYIAAIRAGKIKEPDVIVATSWDTVSYTKRFQKSYKAYFVQDYEPLFYNFGEEYLMCRNTYLQGLHMISLGPWNKHMIERECAELLKTGDDNRTCDIQINASSASGSGRTFEKNECISSSNAEVDRTFGKNECIGSSNAEVDRTFGKNECIGSSNAEVDRTFGKNECISSSNAEVDRTLGKAGLQISVVDFPCDKGGYEHIDHKFEAYPQKKKLTLAVYLKYYGKRLPNLIPYMLVNTAEKLKKEGIELEVLYFGEAKTFSAAGGKNLGQLTKAELNSLYRKADFGMVASMSNISLVPYEMHAAGLPVIEFADGTYPFFFGNDTAFLTRIGEKDIAELLLGAMKYSEKLCEMDAKANEMIEELGWENTGRQFLEALQS